MKATIREAHVQRGIRLEVITVAYNSFEALVALVFGFLAGSVALVGFGLDSVIEVTSGITLLWRLKSDADLITRERSERIALRIVGLCFLALALYVSHESLEALIASEALKRTIPGILLAAVSILVMPILARSKRVVAGQIGSAALVADSKQTSLCSGPRLVVGRSDRGPSDSAYYCQRGLNQVFVQRRGNSVLNGRFYYVSGESCSQTLPKSRDSASIISRVAEHLSDSGFCYHAANRTFP